VLNDSIDSTWLFDVDNTLLDNDRFGADLGAYLTQAFGAAERDRYWGIYATLRDQAGVADYLGALQRFRIGVDDADTEQHEIAEVSGEQLLHALERVRADAAVRAHEQDGGRREPVDLRRRFDGLLVRPLQSLLELAGAASDAVIMPAHQVTEERYHGRDRQRSETSAPEPLGHPPTDC